MKKFLQKSLKKPLALALALLIVVSSISVAVYALYENDKGTMKTYIKISKVNGDGSTTPIEYDDSVGSDDKTGALAVKPGEKIKIELSYYTHVDEKSAQSKADGDNSNFNVQQLTAIYRFNADILKIDLSDCTLKYPYYSRSESTKLEFRDAKNNLSQIKAVPFSGDKSTLPDSNKDTFVEVPVTDSEGETTTNYSYIWNTIAVLSDEELNPSTNGKNLATYYFTVRDDMSAETIAKLAKNNFTLAEVPFSTLDDAFIRLTDSGINGNIYEYPGIVDTLSDEYVDAYGKSFRDVYSTDTFYFTTKEVAETLSFTAGTVNFNTNNTNYNGLGKSVISDKGFTETATNSGIYTASGIEGATITVPTSIVAADGNLTLKGWSTTANATSDATVLTAEELAAITYKSTEPTTLYAVYTSDSYTLNVDDGKGKADSVKSYTVTYGQDITSYLATPEVRTGYTFQGWLPSTVIDNNTDGVTTDAGKNVTKAVFNSAFVSEAKNNNNNTVTVTASWAIKQHTIYYMNKVNGNITSTSDVLDELDINYNTALNETEPANEPDVATGYEFDGWTYYLKNEDGTKGAAYTGDNLPDSDLIAEPQFTAITYKISYDCDNADVVNGTAATTGTITVNCSDDTATLPAPTKTGSTFEGWQVSGATGTYTLSTKDDITKFIAAEFYDADGHKTDNDDNLITTISVKAIWKQIDYTITFTNGTTPDGSNLKADETIATIKDYHYGDKFDTTHAIPDYPSYTDSVTKELVTASGWNIDIKAGDFIPVPTDGNTLTVPAQWTKLYTITFDANGGTIPSAGTTAVSKLAEGKDITVPANPTMTGYNFGGWYLSTDASKTVVQNFGKVGTENLTYIAKWEIKKHSITYTVDGTKVADLCENDVPYNTEKTVAKLPTVAEGSSYTQATWSSSNSEIAATVGSTFKMPDTDIIFSITTAKNKHSITIDKGLGTSETTTNDVEYGTDISATHKLDTLADSSHRFGGWTLTKEVDGNWVTLDKWPTSMPDYNIKAVANWTTLYTVTYKYDVNDATKDVVKQFAEGETITPPAENPEKDGNDFKGWTYKNTSGSGFAGEKMPAENLIAEPVFDIHKLKVTYTLGDKETWSYGESTYTKEFEYGNTLANTEYVPTREGYTFNGWKYASVPGLAYSGDTMPDFDLKATADMQAKSLTLSIDTDGDGNADITPEVKYNEVITNKPADPSKDGKVFDGWFYTDSNGALKSFDFSKSLENQGIAYNDAGYVIAPKFSVEDKYYIANGIGENKWTYADTPAFTYSTNDASEYTVPGADKAVASDYKTKLNFLGWSTSPDSTEIALKGDELGHLIGETGASYYAVYEFVKYNVKFVNEDGSTIYEDSIAYSQQIPQPSKDLEPTKDGYTFAGWLDADGKKVDEYGVMPDKDLTFTAQFTSNDVSAIFYKKNIIGDEYVTFDTIPQKVGTEISVPETNSYNPFKLGYKFTGWADKDGKSIDEYDVMPNGSVEFYAQYELDETAIALTIGGVVVSGAVAGAAVAGNAALITTGAVVGGVALVGGAAALAKHTHKVTYYVDGEVYKTYYCVEGTKVLTPDDPSKDGYTFAGWDSEIPEKMPANDLEFNATWSGNVDDEIPDTGSATAGLAAFAVISSAAAAAYVLTKKKKDEE